MCNLPFAKSRSRPDQSQRKAKLHKRIVFTNYAVPTGALDSRTGREVLDFLKKLNEEGNTIVMITHDSSIALEAKRVVRIHDGKINFDGDVKKYAAII